MKLIYFLVVFCVSSSHSRPGTANSKLVDDCEEDSDESPRGGGPKRYYPDQSDITYPGEHRVVSRMPERPKGSICEHNICEQLDDYPAELILSVMKRNRQYDDYFQETIEIGERVGVDEPNTLCDVKMHAKYPESIVNVNNVKRTIVNVDGYKQALIFETCKQTGPCTFSDSFPNGYVTECKQRYMIKRLLALEGTNQTSFDSFQDDFCILVLKSGSIGVHIKPASICPKGTTATVGCISGTIP